MLRQCLIDVETALKPYCVTLKNSCVDLVQRLFNVVSTLDTDIVSIFCNVENANSGIVSFSTLNQRYLNDDPQFQNSEVSTKKLVFRDTAARLTK